MKALTVCQPHANLLIHRPSLKPDEFRTWTTDYRGPLVIHAGLSRKWLATAEPQELRAAGRLDFGCVIGVTVLEDVRCVSRSFWLDRCDAPQYAWRMSCPVPIDPIYCRGRQGLWNFTDPEELALRLRRALTTPHRFLREVIMYWCAQLESLHAEVLE